MRTKVCTKCRKEKELQDFSKCKKHNDRLSYWCKSCKGLCDKKYQDNNKEKLKIYSKKYYDKNTEKILKYQKEYYILNEEKISIRSKEYYLNNYEIIINRNTKYKNQKRKESKKVQIQGNLSHRIYLSLKDQNKSLSTMMLIGCEIDYLMIHIQTQFTRGMNWENYGLWHIDHIKPCAKFDLSKPKEQSKCFHYTNLQPLWAEDNLRKSDKIL